jgi:hypothetical protein
MTVTRADIPSKARNRSCVPWRLSVSRELTGEEMQALVAAFLSGTEFHYVLQGNVYPGLTMIDGDYWGVYGRKKDLSQVARRWDEVEAQLPDLMPDAVIEYRVPSALLDPAPVHDVQDLTQPTQ